MRLTSLILPLVSPRRLLLPVLAAWAAGAALPPAHAQAWNEQGPTRDTLSNSIGQFDRLRREAERPQSAAVVPGMIPPAPQRAPIPMLDWAAPPPAPAPTRRRTTTRRSPMRQASPAAEPRPASGTSTVEMERRLQDRQAELDRLRLQLDADRQRLDQLRGQGGSTPPR
jgi:hypothetical protein